MRINFHGFGKKMKELVGREGQEGTTAERLLYRASEV